jgi:GTP-binding protein
MLPDGKRIWHRFSHLWPAVSNGEKSSGQAPRRHGADERTLSRYACKVRYATQFLLSALAEEQFPHSQVPEIAFLGRSNVGKSSLLNALVGDKAAKVSSTPGRTRAINFFALRDDSDRTRLVFADLPGYGYAKISKSISATWGNFIDPYLKSREELSLCVCLVDANVPPQKSDAQLFDWLRSAQRDFTVVATKVDRLSGNERTRNLAALKKAFAIEQILPVSAKTGYGVKELWARIEGAAFSS